MEGRGQADTPLLAARSTNGCRRLPARLGLIIDFSLNGGRGEGGGCTWMGVAKWWFVPCSISVYSFDLFQTIIIQSLLYRQIAFLSVCTVVCKGFYCLFSYLFIDLFDLFQQLFQSSFNRVLEQFQSSFKRVKSTIFRAVSEQFQKSFRAISEQFQKSFREFSEQFKSNFRAVSKE